MTKYDAFISYRHSELDMWAAKSIHKGLETFKVPRAVAIKTGKKRIQRVFRDQEELPIGSDLNNNISGALEGSEYLLVICSPRTPESYWVCKEIDTFISMHGREHILAVLIEGEPAQSFPSQLLIDEKGNPVEPLAADIRGEDQKERKKKLKTELLRLAAPVLGCSYDDLRQRHRERRLKKMATIICSATLIVSALSIGFGLYNANMVKKIKAQNEKIEAQNIEINKNYSAKLENQSRYLADTSLRLFEEGDRKAAALVAMEALSGEDKPYVPHAEYALSKALYAYDTGDTIGMDRTLRHMMPVSKLSFNSEGNYLVTMDNGYTAYVWDVATGKLLHEEKAVIQDNGYKDTVKEVGSYLDNMIIVTDYSIKSVDFSGAENWKYSSEEMISYARIDENGNRAFLTTSNAIMIISLENGNVIDTIINEDEDTTYSGTVKYLDGIDIIAISRYSGFDATNAKVSVIDLNSKTDDIYEFDFNYVSEGFITPSGNVALQLVDVYYNGITYGAKTRAAVALIDAKSKKIKWIKDDTALLMDDNSTSPIIKAVYAKDSEGNECVRVVAARDNHLQVFDEETGSLISECYFNGGIEGVFLLAGGEYAYVAENNGNIDVIGLSTGKNFNNFTIETNKSLRNLAIRNGYIAVQERLSSDVTLLTYHEGVGREIFVENDADIANMIISLDGKYIASNHYDNQLNVYDMADGKKVFDEVVDDEGVILYKGFIGEEILAVMNADGDIRLINILDGTDKTIKLDADDVTILNAYVTDNQRYAAFCSHYEAFVVDFSNNNVVKIDAPDKEQFNKVLVSENGKTVYLNTDAGNIYAYDIDNKEFKVIIENFDLIATYNKESISMALSNDDKYLALVSSKGVLKIIDIASKSVISEFEYNCQSRSFIKFIPGKDIILCQSDDYYIRAYDIANNVFMGDTSTKWEQINSLNYDEGRGIIILSTNHSLIFMDEGSFEVIAQAGDALVYDKLTGTIYSKSGDNICKFKYMSLNDLFNEVKRQFGDEKLSDEEKRNYCI